MAEKGPGNFYRVSAQTNGKQWAVRMAEKGPGNFYRVSADLYRSAQPENKNYPQLQALGIRSVLNLRYHHRNPKNGAADYRLNFLAVPFSAVDLTSAELTKALRLFKTAPKPVLVHCWHGSDRTGTFCAAYRIVFEDWSVEAALDELKNGGFGFHRRLYANIPELFRAVDWPAVQAAGLAEENRPPPEAGS